MKKLWIRPVHPKPDGPLKSLALCQTPGEILFDEQIILHFPPDEPGKDVEATAVEFYGATEVEWGKPIYY